MPNPAFNLVWASERTDLTPLTDEFYENGFLSLGGDKLQTRHHDYPFQFIDLKLKYLYEQIGFGTNGNILLPDAGATTSATATGNVTLVSAGVTLVGTANHNTVIGSNGYSVTGNANLVLNSSGSVTGSNNNIFNSSSTIGGIDYGTLIDSSLSSASSSSHLVFINVSGVSVSGSQRVGAFGGSSTAFVNSQNCYAMGNSATVTFSGSTASFVAGSVSADITDSDRGVILASTNVQIDNFDNVTILSSQNVKARKKNTVVMGYAASGAPAAANITVEIDVELGRIDAKQYYLNGSPFTGGLSYLTEFKVSAAPNATIPVEGLLCAGAETNIDLVFAPKGDGSLLLDTPDSTATGGNKRGARSIDLQMSRSAADQVVSGNDSYAFGRNNKLTGDGSVIVGTNNEGGGTSAHILGYQNIITAGGFAWGSNNYSASSTYMVGSDGHGRDFFGSRVFSNGKFTGATPLATFNGSCQMRDVLLRRRTTGNGATQVTSTGGAISATNTFVLADNCTVRMEAEVTAREESTGESKIWIIKAAAKRDAGAGTIVLIGSPNVAVEFSTAGTAGWAGTVTAAVNTTRGSFDVNVQGEAAKNIRWQAYVRYNEVTDA